MFRINRRLCAALITASAGLAVAAAVQAPAGAAPRSTQTAHSKQVQAELQQLTAQGASDAQIRKQTGLVLVSSAGSSRAPLSLNSAVSVSTPKVYFDGPAKSYYVAAGWKFKKAPDKKAGGLDGFGLRFSQEINSINGSLNVCGNLTKPSCVRAKNYWDNNQYGASWKFQDWNFGSLSTSLTGSLTFAFKRLHGGCLQAFTTYAHTWESTSITGFSVSKTGFGISWTKKTNYWQRASSAGKIGC